MTDERLEGEQLTGLFAEGTAPERDAAFTRRVNDRIDRARLGRCLSALAIRALVILTLAAAVFVTIRTLEPMLAPILEPVVESSPHFMGVPLPLVLAAAALSLGLYAMRLLRLRLI